MDIAIANRHFGLVVTTAGGSVWRFFARREGAEVPIFRAPPPGEARAPLASGCFPLVPFGNRVRGNRFAFEGREHRLEPNTDRDPIISTATAGRATGRSSMPGRPGSASGWNTATAARPTPIRPSRPSRSTAPPSS